jgi:hypothetical protein
LLGAAHYLQGGLRRNWGALNFLKPEKFEKYRDEIRGALK